MNANMLQVTTPQSRLPELIAAAGERASMRFLESIAEEALRASAVDFRVQTQTTCFGLPIPDTQPRTLGGGWRRVVFLYLARLCDRRDRLLGGEQLHGFDR